MSFRQYRTTANDRAVRMNNRNQATDRNAGILSNSGFPARSNNANPLPPSCQPCLTPLPPPFSHSQSRISASSPVISQLSQSVSLIDFDNDVLESCATVRDNALIDLAQDVTSADQGRQRIRFSLPEGGESTCSFGRLNSNNMGRLDPVPSFAVNRNLAARSDVEPMTMSTFNCPDSFDSTETQYANCPQPDRTFVMSSRSMRLLHNEESSGRAVNGRHEPQRVSTVTAMSETDRMVIVQLMKKIVPCNGTDDRMLINFLIELKPVFEIAPMHSQEIIKLLLPYVAGQLFNLWLKAISCGASWDELHWEILKQFLPDLRKRELENLMLERPQGVTENFVEYVENIVGVGFALKTRLTEKEIVEIILSKCTPQTRSHFGFGTMPTNIAELQQLANRVASSISAETRYFGNNNRQPIQRCTFENISAPATQTRQHNSMRQNEQTRGRNNLKCYRCQATGHVARSCRANLN